MVGGRGRRVVVLGVWVRQHKEQGRKCRGMGVCMGVSRRSRYFESHKGGQLHWGKLFGSKNESHPRFSPPFTVTHPRRVPLKARLPPSPPQPGFHFLWWSLFRPQCHDRPEKVSPEERFKLWGTLTISGSETSLNGVICTCLYLLPPLINEFCVFTTQFEE